MLRLIAENELLAEDGVIVAEHRREEKMPEELHGFQKQKNEDTGSSCFPFMQMVESRV